jgi:agmatine deiminase
VNVIEAPVDDIWMRDIMPTFAWRGERAAKEVVAIDWNFNGWGGTRERPPRAGDRLAKTAATIFGVPSISVPFIAEGGAFITDGHGTLITTRSCLLNPNRNPARRRLDRQRVIEAELRTFNVGKVVWLEGDPCELVTSGHIDGYTMCAPGGVVLVEGIDDKDAEPPLWRDHDVALLGSARDAEGRKLKVVRVLAPRKRYWKRRSNYFAPCYLNAYVANGAVIGALFGDPERHEAARRALSDTFPGREIMMLRINNIANGGGGVHCLTQPMPRS